MSEKDKLNDSLPCVLCGEQIPGPHDPDETARGALCMACMKSIQDRQHYYRKSRQPKDPLDAFMGKLSKGVPTNLAGAERLPKFVKQLKTELNELEHEAHKNRDAAEGFGMETVIIRIRKFIRERLLTTP